MRKTALIALSLFWAGAAVLGCSQKETPAPVAAAPASDAPPAAAPAPEGKSFTGSVTETMDVGGYTYVQVDTGIEKIWGAAPKFAVAVGERVTVPASMPMQGYHSKSLDRTFEVLYFADAILPEGASAGAEGAGHRGAPAAPSAAEAAVDLTGIAKASGGRTVGEILSAPADHAGKEVSFRGRVVKVNSGIMGKNWLHVQDGTGEVGQNDLLVTTDASAEVGDLVLVRGKAATDKDFGYGYKYAFIVEDAQVAVE